ncbi:MAG: hypothetical protein MJ252_20820 [archaeon]|nr:hypothetical protein [archaeon]
MAQRNQEKDKKSPLYGNIKNINLFLDKDYLKNKSSNATLTLRKDKVSNYLASKRKAIPAETTKKYYLNMNELVISNENIIDEGMFAANVNILLLFLLFFSQMLILLFIISPVMMSTYLYTPVKLFLITYKV